MKGWAHEYFICQTNLKWESDVGEPPRLCMPAPPFNNSFVRSNLWLEWLDSDPTPLFSTTYCHEMPWDAKPLGLHWCYLLRSCSIAQCWDGTPCGPCVHMIVLSTMQRASSQTFKPPTPKWEELSLAFVILKALLTWKGPLSYSCRGCVDPLYLSQDKDL
jgi:hypothetical protein